MGTIQAPDKVKLFAGLLLAQGQEMERVEPLLTERWGAVDARSETIPFTFTGYYAPEMGEGVRRLWISFRDLVAPEALARIKVATNALETGFLKDGRRQVNIDPGYITPAKVVLASTKDFSHRIYIGEGIYAEITLLYRHGEFVALPWTYPDYQSAAATAFLTEARDICRRQTHPR
jgi:hypothetical protein